MWYDCPPTYISGDSLSETCIFVNENQKVLITKLAQWHSCDNADMWICTMSLPPNRLETPHLTCQKPMFWSRSPLMVDHEGRKPRGLAESYEPRKVSQTELPAFFLSTADSSGLNCVTWTKAATLTPPVCLFRNGGRGVQCLLLFPGVSRYSGDGLLHQEAEVSGGSGLQL